MTSNERPPDSGRLTLSSMRRTALVAGVLYLITFVSSIPAVFLLGPVLTDPNFIIGGAAPTRYASAPSSTSSTASPPSGPPSRSTRS